MSYLAFALVGKTHPKYCLDMGNIGSHYAPFVLAKLDGRTREAKFVRDMRNDMAARLDGNPTATQWRGIETAAWLSLQIMLLDTKAADGGALTATEVRSRAALHDSLERVLRDLGLHAASAIPSAFAASTVEAAA